jgi:3-hydroxybutyrate dehydrogenase
MLKNKVAIITGSTSGIGLSIARELAKEGCKIMLNGLGDKEDIEKTKKDLRDEFSTEIEYSNADMSKPDQIQDMALQIQERFGKCDILVNNAGIQFTASIEDFPPDKWETILSINLSAAFYTIRAILPILKKQGWGRIINIASAHGLVASQNKAAYVSAKHGLVGLTKVVALENATNNITCNAICPGWVHTPLVQQQIVNLAKQESISLEDATVKLLEDKQPSLKFVDSKHLGRMVVFLCSEAGSSITGAALSVDGGWTAQ